MQCLSKIEDPAVGTRKRQNLDEVPVISVCAISAGILDFERMGWQSRVRQSWLRRAHRLEDGFFFHDTFARIFRILDPKHLDQTFGRWVGGVGSCASSACVHRPTARSCRTLR